MSGESTLKILKDHAKDLLLAEAAAWLHDLYKYTDDHIRNVARGRSDEERKQRHREILQAVYSLRSSINDVKIKVNENEAVKVADLFSYWQLSRGQRRCYPLNMLGRCHGAAHVEKEETDDTGRQEAIDTRPSSPFGYEASPVVLPRLEKNVKELKDLLGGFNNFIAKPTERDFFKKMVKAPFTNALSETRRPENEVSLWDWALIVSALFKALLAGALLSEHLLGRICPETPKGARWRLLSVWFSGLDYLSQAHRIPDLLGRKQALKAALDQVKELLEVKYPLGTEVYRDENGSIFVVPGCEKGNCTLDPLKFADSNDNTLEDLLKEIFLRALDGEIVPQLKIDPEPWWGQDPEWKRKQERGVLQFNDEYPPVAEHLKPVQSEPDPEEIAREWQQTPNAEVCTVCGLRPQSQSSGLRDRHICEVCNKRRDRRVKAWLEDLRTTIWISEVADRNARVALIVGRFDLSHWLEGSLVRTLRVTDPADPRPPKYVPTKIPSFVRLHRIWTTIQRFWCEVAPVPVTVDEEGDKAPERERYIAELKESIVGSVLKSVGPRLAIYGTLKDGAEDHPIRFHVYELVLERGGRLSVVWDGERFIACDNLEYLESERQLGRPVKNALQRATVRVEQPVGYGAQNKRIGEFVVREAKEIENIKYVPVIPLLAEPQTFMVLVPAEYAIEIVKKIKAKYEREMGKVRNRLPLHLGIVFAHRRTPLRAILDAGRRLLQTQGLPVAGWRVEKNGEAQNAFEGDPHFAKTLRLRLKLGDREATWLVPLMMGDGDPRDPSKGTKDVWYPYVFRHGPEPLSAQRRFSAQNPWDRDRHGAPQEGWLVHVEDLEKDDTIYFTPATFDWVWLDTNARRFEIAYDEQGQRRSPHLKRRPYLLDELEVLEQIWETFEAHLSRNQIHILRETIEAKRAQWGYPSPYDEGFRRFCHDLLAEVEWRRGALEAEVPEKRRERFPWEVEGLEKSEWLEKWAGYAARGWLADAVELYWEILKGGREREEEPVREAERT